MKPKIFFDARMIDHAGIGVYIQNLLKGLLKENRWQISLIVFPNAWKKHPFLHDFDLIVLHCPIYSPLEQIKIPLLVSSCDLFWVPHFNAPILPTKAKKRLVTIHDVYHIAYQKNFSSLKRAYVKQLYKSAIGNADQLVTVSSFSKSEINKYFPHAKKKVTVIHNGIDKTLFQNNEKANSYSLPEQYFLFVGSVKPHKNLKELILAFKELIRVYPQYYLVVVGKREGFFHGENLSEVLSDEGILERVKFFQNVKNEELANFYRKAKAFVFPSLYEGFGLPLLEAMECRCPIVASDRTSIPEVSGDAALFFDPSDKDAIFRALRKIIEDKTLVNNLVERGSKRVSHFSWERALKEHIQIIERMIDENSTCS